MSVRMRALLAGVCLILLAATGVASGQIKSGMKQAPGPLPVINLGKRPLGAADANAQGVKSVTTAPGRALTFTRGQPALAYPPSDLAVTNTNAVPHSAVRVILSPASAEESQQARASRVFPQNLNEGAVEGEGAASKGVLRATGITGDTNAAGPASIAELARSLRYDPDLIYQYVRNNIEVYPIFGVQKGALGAVLDNQGTAFDQAMLMVALLRTSGIDAKFMRGAVKLSAAEFRSWYGFDTSNACAVMNLVAQGQIPIFGFTTASGGKCPGPVTALVSATVEHIWVKAKIGGTWYVFDPSRKPHSIKNGIDLASPATTGYNLASYVNDANLSSTSSLDWVQNINRANIRKNLDSYAGHLANYLRSNKPTATLDDVIGGKAIDPFYDSLRQTTLPYQDLSLPSEEIASISNSYKPTLRIQYQGIDQTYTSDFIYGRRLTITYNGANQSVLKLDGMAIGKPGTAAATGAATSIKFTVNHNAYLTPSADETFSQTLTAGGTNTYAIANAWGPSGRGPAENFRALISDLRASSGTNPDASEPVLGSTLAMIGAQWIAQADQASYVTGQIANASMLVHHRVGIVGYVNNAYVDLAGNMFSVGSMDGDFITESAAIASAAMHSSMLESTAVEQTTGTPAVSTIKLIDIASAAGQRIYNGTAARFASSVQPNLINCASELPAMNAALAAGSRVITPTRCDITENKWSGAGYLAMGPGLQLGAMISGGLAGGFGSQKQTPAQASTNVSNNQQQQRDLSGTAFTFNDPIDMVRGRFVYDHEDIDAGIGAFPQTLAFKRLYSSGSRTSDGILGKGWTHNLNITAVTGSDGFQAMGEDSALDAVGSVIEQKVSLDLLMDAARPLNKIVIATLGQRWFGDQLINNTVIVTQGAGAEVFVKLPDGTYNPPPGKSAKLTKNADATFSYESLNRDVLKFNAAGKAESYIDPSGVQVKYVYSGNDVVEIKNSLGRMLALTYANGRISKVTNGVSTVGYSYDAGANLSAFTDALGKNTTYSYSLPGRMASIYYPSFPTVAAVTNTYDSLHRVQTQTNARGKTYEYFFAGSRTEEIAPGGGARTNYIDGQGNVVLLSSAMGNLTANIYDGQSRLIRSELPEGNATEYAYDDATCASSEKRCTHAVKSIKKVGPVGSGVEPLTQSFTYERAFNRVASASDPEGNITGYTYTPQGLPLTVTSPTDTAGVAPVTTYSYSSYTPSGFPPFYLPTSVAVKTAANNEVVTATTYDTSNGFVPATSTIDAGPGGLNLTTSFTYDVSGNLLSVKNPASSINTIAYDAARRVTRTTDAAGAITVTSYDSDGRPIATATQVSRKPSNVFEWDWMVSCRRYSATGKPIRVWGPGFSASADACPVEAAPTAITDTSYDDLDRAWRVTQQLRPAEGGARVTESLYNADDTLQSIRHAVGTALAQPYATYVYTPNGNVDSVIDAKGNRTVLAYDVFDRLTHTYYPHPTLVDYGNSDDFQQNTYDANGNVTIMRKRNGRRITQTWDDLNRLISRTYPNASDNVRFTYDLRGLRTEARFATGLHSNVYKWDNAGRLSSAIADGRALTYRYDAAGNRTRLTWPDGFFINTGYDARNYPMNLSSGSEYLLASYGYDRLGRSIGMTWSNGSVTSYKYNEQGARSSLGRSFYPPVDEGYTYTRNQAGELTGVSWSNDVAQWTGTAPDRRSYTSNGLNQYKSIPDGSPTYDANGNLASDGSSSYAYDLDNRLKTAIRAGTVARLDYDPEGRLQKTDIGGKTTTLLYDGNNLIAEYDAAGVMQRRYVHSPGVDEQLLWYDGERLATKTFMYADHLGSIVSTADINGVRTGTYTYGPNGEPGETVGPRFRFTGQQYIAELGLYYYKARFYAPRLGRFLQTDPVGTKDDLNLYAYVGNNPVNRVDPTGLASVTFGNQAAIQVAARGVPMTGNAPGGFRLNPNGVDTDYFDGAGNLTAQYHESHGEAHGHNFFDGSRDPTHLPMSPIPR
jgi:RHS repeat-associated protein